MSCAVALTLLKFRKFSDISYTILFSTGGFCDNAGSLKFSKTIDLKSSYNLEVSSIVLLKVVDGIRRFDRDESNEDIFPVVGNGFVPLLQRVLKIEKKILKDLEIIYSSKESKCNGADTFHFGVCCYDKSGGESLGCASDGFELFVFLGSKLFFEHMNVKKKAKSNEIDDEKKKFRTVQKRKIGEIKSSFEVLLQSREFEVRKIEEEIEGEGEED